MATSLADLYKTQYALATQETSNEKFANSLMEGTKDLPMNSLGSGLAKGLATGYAAGTAKKEGSRRERETAFLRDKLAYEQKRLEHLQSVQDELELMKGAQESRTIMQNNIDMSLDAFQSTGDLSMLNETMQNQSAAPLRALFERQVTAKGGVFQGFTATPEGDLLPYGVTPQGERVYGDAMPVEKAYSQTYLQNKQAKQLERDKKLLEYQASQQEYNQTRELFPLEQQKLQADINAQNALTDKRRGGVEDGYTQKTITDINGDQVTVQVPMGQPKPMPASIVKTQNETIDQIQTMQNINSDLGKFDEMMTNKDLDFGFFENKWDAVRNTIGLSNEESRNSASFRSTLEKLRNDSLRLNNGVQTEGDAQRAWNELFSSMNDKNLVQQRLREIMAINERGARLKAVGLDRMRMEYGQTPYDYSGMEYKPVVGQGQGGGTESGGVQEGQTATNPNTGEKIIFRGGQWQRM